MATATATSASSTFDGSGRTHHSATVPARQIAVNSASQGLRRPAWSAMAPSIGLSTAMASPEMAMARLQAAVPATSLSATALVK